MGHRPRPILGGHPGHCKGVQDRAARRREGLPQVPPRPAGPYGGGALSVEGGSSPWRRVVGKVCYECERLKARLSEEYAAEEEKRAERRMEIIGRTADSVGVAMDEVEKRRVEVQNKLPWQLESFKECPPES